MDIKQDSCLPSGDSNSVLANKFLTYFKDKIFKIRETFTNHTNVPDAVTEPVTELLDKFDPATDDELCAIVTSYGVSSCSRAVLVKSFYNLATSIIAESHVNIIERYKSMYIICENNKPEAI